MMRQLASGIFSWLPLGYRSVKKAIDILNEEMDRIGGQEFLLPALNPIDIWEQTGRVEAMGDVLFHIKNREGLVLAPTHEEIIAFHAKQHISSYRDLPQIWYQVQNKFRNEARPKSGVLRGRQFIMKDAYSLDSTWEGLDESYNKHYEAYRNIFTRCGIEFFVVGASSGAMGGSNSQEFMVASDAGEDICAVNMETGYAANIEVAVSAMPPVSRIGNNESISEFPTPNARTIDELMEQYSLDEDRCAKSVVYMIDGNPVLIMMRGNDELNESKLQSVFGTADFRPALPEELVRFTGANAGSIGPVGLATAMDIYADLMLQDADGLVSGANKDGFHYKNIDMKRDCVIKEFRDFRTVRPGEPDTIGGKPLGVVKSIELGHIFKLGTKYSQALGANFLNAEGKEEPVIMGSYGIGVERILACFIEQNHDDKGIVWKRSLAPFDIHLIGVLVEKSETVRAAGEEIYAGLQEAGYEVLYDDRIERPGVKFNDADLIGLPLQVILGEKSLANGEVEIKIRSTQEKHYCRKEDLTAFVNEYFGG